MLIEILNRNDLDLKIALTKARPWRRRMRAGDVIGESF
jgi:hypothetical protein